jgi:hypothetical protein
VYAEETYKILPSWTQKLKSHEPILYINRTPRCKFTGSSSRPPEDHDTRELFSGRNKKASIEFPWCPFWAHHPCPFNTTHLGCRGSSYRNHQTMPYSVANYHYCGAEACAFATSTAALLGTRAKTAQAIPIVLQNVELQIVELQKAEFQNIELQNTKLQNAEVQNVESYTTSNLTES